MAFRTTRPSGLASAFLKSACVKPSLRRMMADMEVLEMERTSEEVTVRPFSWSRASGVEGGEGLLSSDQAMEKG